MKKVLSLFVLSVFCLSLVAAGSGAIWTTTSTCGNPQNVNQYAAGEKVYIQEHMLGI
jgi:hypothetical protein